MQEIKNKTNEKKLLKNSINLNVLLQAHTNSVFATGTTLISTLLYLSEVKGVERERLGLLEGHDLDEEGPGREVSVGDGVEQVSDGVIGVGGSESVGLLHRQVLDALVGLKEQGRSHDEKEDHRQ